MILMEPLELIYSNDTNGTYISMILMQLVYSNDINETNDTYIF